MNGFKWNQEAWCFSGRVASCLPSAGMVTGRAEGERAGAGDGPELGLLREDSRAGYMDPWTSGSVAPF